MNRNREAKIAGASERRHCLLFAILLQIGFLTGISGFDRPALADTPDRQAASFASGAGNVLYLAAGVGLPLVQDGRAGRTHALRIADALGTSVLFSEGLKSFVRERRPNGGSYDSFPSGHATAAFAVATTESAFHPRQALFWYAGATAIGLSRLRLNEHRTHDVVIGGLLGYATARWELSRPRGLILSPWIPSSRNGGVGLQLTGGF